MKKSELLEWVVEGAKAAIAGAFIILIVWLYLMATPDQMSAECDYCASQMEWGAK